MDLIYLRCIVNNCCFIYIYIYVYQPIGIMVWVFANGPGTEVQSQVESYQRLKKWCLMLPCLTLNIIKYGSRVKWSNPEKELVSSPTPRCSCYRKGNLRVTLDYGHLLYLLLIYIPINIKLVPFKTMIVKETHHWGICKHIQSWW